MYSRLRRQLMLLSVVFILGLTGFAFAETPAHKIQPNDKEISAVYVRFGPRGYNRGYYPYRNRYYPGYYGGYPYYRYRTNYPYYNRDYYYYNQNRPWGWGGGVYIR